MLDILTQEPKGAELFAKSVYASLGVDGSGKSRLVFSHFALNSHPSSSDTWHEFTHASATPEEGICVSMLGATCAHRRR